MKLKYQCDFCGEYLGEVEVDEFEFDEIEEDFLTGEERHGIINMDLATGKVVIKTLCDECMEALEFDNDFTFRRQPLIH